jgi:uncharacterized protein (AIM24 family)
MSVREQLLGSTQPVLCISLEPGERIVAKTGEFAWMTDAIQMTASLAGLSDYMATGQAGTVAFASRLPGSILQIEVTPDHEYLVHRNGFVAATPGIEVSIGFQQVLATAEVSAEEFILRRIGGRGRAWVELSGDVVRRDLATGTSLRTHPWHVGMSDASVAVQMAELAAPAGSNLSADAQHCAVLSGPGTVWLQSMPAAPYRRLAVGPMPAQSGPAAEGTAGPDAPPETPLLPIPPKPSTR